MKTYTIEEIRAFVQANLDKRFIIITTKEEDGPAIGVISRTQDLWEEFKDDQATGVCETIIGLEFTEGIQDCQGGYWNKEEDGQD